jgi:uncharacterized protein (TIGR00299 family) protein
MSIGWLDGAAGATGEMLLGALVGAGVPIQILQASVDPLHLDIRLSAEEVTRGALSATKVHVEVPTNRRVRHLPDIVQMFDALPPSIAGTAASVLRCLAAAEAAAHRIAVEEVHFHEVGVLHRIADIVASVAGVEHLGLSELHCSALSLGAGWAQTDHGTSPVPVPAVLELLSGVAPVQAGRALFESTTPTGAALLVTLVDTWGPLPPMTIGRAGVGAGGRNPAELPNALRLVIGDKAACRLSQPEAVQLEANVDDLDPRVWPIAIAAIMTAGAHDAWVTPISMKKGRPAFTVSALCNPSDVEGVRRAIFRHTSTIGLREFPVAKHCLERSNAVVEIGGMPVRVKLASLDGQILNRSVEWDDVVVVAEALGRSTKDVLAAATSEAARREESYA